MSARRRTPFGALLASAALLGAASLTACLPPPPSTPVAAPSGISVSVTFTPTTAPPLAPVAGPTSRPTPKPTAHPASESACVASTMAGLSLKEKVGQLVMAGTSVNNPSAVDATLSKYEIGNVFLAGRSTHSAATLKSAIAGLQTVSLHATGIRLQISLDQEGGEVQTLKGPGFPLFPSAQTQGVWMASTLHANTINWARPLVSIGVTLDLAPVADTVPAGIGTANPPIGAFHREYGSDPTVVTRDISTVVAAAASVGLMVTLKHFPGLGRVRANTDTSTAAVDDTTTVTDPYLEPFAGGIRAGALAVMVSSASYPKLDAHSIAAFSEPIVTGLLRGRLGFTGIVISDDLGSAVAVRSVPVGDRAVRFIQAGGDIVLSVNTYDAGVMADALLTKARGSATFTGQVNRAAALVLDGKYRSGVLTCPTPKP